MDQNQNNRRQVSGERKAIYYVGLGLVVTGFLLFFSVFLSAATGFGSMPGPGSPGFGTGGEFGSIALRGFIGMGLMILGSVLMNVGSRGLAGSGVVLDPEQARRELEPWSRMAGGMAKDALDEADVRLGQAQDGNELSFDDKLRRLDQLRKDGLLTEDEFQKKRAEILTDKW